MYKDGGPLKTKIILILFVVLIGSCTVNPSSATIPPVVDRSASVAITVTPSATYLQAATPRPTPKFTTETLPTVQVLPTRTPQPTLDSLEAEKTVVEYLQSNGGCKLPCWWGISPGETTLEEAEILLESIGQVKKSDEGNSLGYQYQVPNYPEGFFILSNLYSEQGKVKEIFVYANGTGESFSLSKLLTNYGKPDDVLLQVDQEVPCGYPRFIMLIVYKNQGIIAEFEAIKRKDGQYLRGCFIDRSDYASGPSLWLFDVGDPQKIVQSSIYSHMKTDKVPMQPPVLSIEQATGMDIETFYQKYKDPSNYCIFTPSILWPDFDQLKATATAMFLSTLKAEPDQSQIAE